MNPTALIPILEVLQAVWPNWGLSKTDVGIWCAIFADQDPKALTCAALRYCRQGKYPPKPADLLELLADEEPRLEADEAWAAVIEAIRDVGYTHTPDWHDPRITEALRTFGGWPNFCKNLMRVGTPEHAADRKRFIDAFNAATGRERDRAENGFVQDLLDNALGDVKGLLPEVGEDPDALAEPPPSPPDTGESDDTGGMDQ